MKTKSKDTEKEKPYLSIVFNRKMINGIDYLVRRKVFRDGKVDCGHAGLMISCWSRWRDLLATSVKGFDHRVRPPQKLWLVLYKKNAEGRIPIDTYGPYDMVIDGREFHSVDVWRVIPYGLCYSVRRYYAEIWYQG